MNADEKKDLALFAVKIREGILISTHAAKSGHPGGGLSATEYFAYLYGKEMHIYPKNPRQEDRDRFVLSKGHCAPGLYAALPTKAFSPSKT